jgi:hypothetical protein
MGYDSSTADAQFRYIIRRSGYYAAEGLPVISVDTKSRDLIGRFHQAGRRRSREPVKVFDHDFPSDADGVAIPYGIYGPFRNHGFVSVGITCDTSQFSVDTISTWWAEFGARDYYNADRQSFDPDRALNRRSYVGETRVTLPEKVRSWAEIRH